MNKLNSLIYIVLIWLLAVLISVPAFVANDLRIVRFMPDNQEIYTTCEELWFNRSIYHTYSIFIVSIQYIVPLIIVSTTNLRICNYLIIHVPTIYSYSFKKKSSRRPSTLIAYLHPNSAAKNSEKQTRSASTNTIRMLDRKHQASSVSRANKLKSFDLNSIDRDEDQTQNLVVSSKKNRLLSVSGNELSTGMANASSNHLLLSELSGTSSSPMVKENSNLNNNNAEHQAHTVTFDQQQVDHASDHTGPGSKKAARLQNISAVSVDHHHNNQNTIIFAEEGHHEKQDRARFKRSKYLLLFVSLSFGICWLPTAMINMISLFLDAHSFNSLTTKPVENTMPMNNSSTNSSGGPDSVTGYPSQSLTHKLHSREFTFYGEHYILIVLISNLIATASSFVNPIIYGLFNTNFKDELGNIFDDLFNRSGPRFTITRASHSFTSSFRNGGHNNHHNNHPQQNPAANGSSVQTQVQVQYLNHAQVI